MPIRSLYAYPRLTRMVQITRRERTLGEVPELEILLTQTLEQLRKDPRRFNEIFRNLRSKLDEINGFPVLPPQYLKSYQENASSQWYLTMLYIFPPCDERLDLTGKRWELWSDHCLLCEPKIQPRPAFSLTCELLSPIPTTLRISSQKNYAIV